MFRPPMRTADTYAGEKDGLPVVLVVPLLMEALPAELADPGLVPVVDPHVGVQRRAPE